MTNRYQVQEERARFLHWSIVDTTMEDYEWFSGAIVAMFMSRDHAEQFCNNLNAAERTRERQRRLDREETIRLRDARLDWKPSKETLKLWAEDNLKPVTITLDMLRAATQHKDAIPPPAPSDPGHGLIKEYLTKGIDYSSAGDYQVRHVWDPSKFCEPTQRERERHLSSIVKPHHPSDGERVRCCRAHADPVFMFNDEVWKSLKERCDG